MNPDEQQKIEALESVKELSSFMSSMGMESWSKRYQVIATALTENNIRHAVNLESNIPKGGMGGLTDLYISRQNGHNTVEPEKDNELLMQYIDRVSRAFSKLRKQLKGYAK